MSAPDRECTSQASVLHFSEAMAGGVESAAVEYVRSTPQFTHHLVYMPRGNFATGDLTSSPFATVYKARNAFKLCMEFIRTARELGPEVIHLHSAWAGLVGRVIPRHVLRAKVVVYSPHSFYFDRSDISRVRRTAAVWLERLLAPRADYIAAVSPHEQNSALILGGNALYVPNVVRLEPKRDHEIQPLIVTVGRLSPQKDPAFFAEVKRRTGAVGDAYRWLWIGGGDYERVALETQGIEVTGWIPRPRVIEILRSATMYVHTAAWEGSPITLLEVQALELPSVVRSNDAVVSLGWEAGLNDPEAVARRLVQSLRRATTSTLRLPTLDRQIELQSEALAAIYTSARQNKQAPQLRGITVAHDYFTQRGGAERVAIALITGMKPERVVTSIYTPESTFDLRPEQKVETTFVQRIAQFRRDPRRAMLALPIAWRLARPVNNGIVICSSSGWSHGIRTGPDAYKVVYCHNPARWLYQPDDYFKDQPAVLRRTMAAIRPLLLRWDKVAARSADVYIANSTAVADRIRRVYNREPVLIHPPISIDDAGVLTPILSTPRQFFLTVGRGRGYKNIDLLVAAFATLPQENLVVVGQEPDSTETPPNVTFVSDISDGELRWLYSEAQALISVSHEDFGLTPLEANAFGTPALVLRAGGFLDSLAEGVSGSFIEAADTTSITDAIAAFPTNWDTGSIRQHAARFSMSEFLKQMNSVLSALPTTTIRP